MTTFNELARWFVIEMGKDRFKAHECKSRYRVFILHHLGADIMEMVYLWNQRIL